MRARSFRTLFLALTAFLGGVPPAAAVAASLAVEEDVGRDIDEEEEEGRVAFVRFGPGGLGDPKKASPSTGPGG
jgi:hypothetical protein